jgi:hypothetical protein
MTDETWDDSPAEQPAEQPDEPTEARTVSVGDELDVTPGSTVEYPTGAQMVVAGATFVIDRPGTYVVDGTEVTAT